MSNEINPVRRTLVVLDDDECGISAFERVLETESPDDLDIRLIVRAASHSEVDIAAAQTLLQEATLTAQQHGFTGAGRAVVRNASDLDAELADAMTFDDAVIIMPESAWPTSQSARLRRSAKRYDALVRFDCVTD